ncbi:MAG: glycosyltransferase family 4 protein [Anaerolineae bacterium]|nr:glycosyltransferase family 4 protein [Anaerolineae bacterium]
MRVLMLVQLIDEQEWLRGFTVKWVRALAARVERVEVITLEMGQASLPENVRVQSMGKEKGKNRLRELIGFHRAMVNVIRDVDVIFSHMTPRYTWLSAPYAWMYHKPQVLWYTHNHASWELRLAHAAARQIVTAIPQSYPLPGDKVHTIGHGIDMEQFKPTGQPPEERTILAVGRLMPRKQHELLIEAMANLIARPGFEDVRLMIAGGETPQYPGYAEHLQALIDERGLTGQVEMLGAVPFTEIQSLYQQAAVVANLSTTGGLDKVVLESMASGVPVVVQDELYSSLLEDNADRLRCETLAPEIIAGKLAGVLSLSPVERRALGLELAEQVHSEHDIEGLFDRLVGIFEQIIAG